jgi:hypothetical protein
MSDVNFVTDLGIWPNDYPRQLSFINDLKLRLQRANNFIVSNAGLTVTLKQAAEPTQSDWETAWIAQTGLSLPIPPSAQLLWWNTNTDRFGGMYGTVEGNETPYRRDHAYPRGGTVMIKTNYKVDQKSLTYRIGSVLSDHPSVTIDLPVKADLYMEYSLFVSLSSGSGQWGGDFLVNGVKVGTQYYGLAPDQGIVNAMTSCQLRVPFILADAEPGEYTVQAIFGVTATPASPPTLVIGGASGAGSYGARQLIVRAIAKG